MTYTLDIISLSISTFLSVQVFCAYRSGVEIEGVMGRLLVGLSMFLPSAILYFYKLSFGTLAVPFLIILFYYCVFNHLIWVYSSRLIWVYSIHFIRVYNLPKALIAALLYYVCVITLAEIISVLLPWVSIIFLILPIFLIAFLTHPKRYS